MVLAASIWECPVIYISTCGVYDRCSISWKQETDALSSFGSSYLAAKLSGEDEFRSLPHATILRISAPIGEGVRENFIFGRFLNLALNSGTLEVWGSGEREQDFIDVRDIACAVQLSLSTRQPGTYNVASGRPVTMLDLALTICEVVGRGAVRVTSESDPQDGTTARYSIQKMMSTFAWKPKFSLKDTVSFLLKSSRAQATSSAAS